MVASLVSGYNCGYSSHSAGNVQDSCCEKIKCVLKKVALVALPLLIGAGAGAAMFFAGLPVVAAISVGASVAGLGLLILAAVSAIKKGKVQASQQGQAESQHPVSESPSNLPKSPSEERGDTSPICGAKGDEPIYDVPNSKPLTLPKHHYDVPNPNKKHYDVPRLDAGSINDNEKQNVGQSSVASTAVKVASAAASAIGGAVKALGSAVADAVRIIPTPGGIASAVAGVATGALGWYWWL